MVERGCLPQPTLQAARKLLLFLNGDATSPRIQHYCTGCCASREDAVGKLFGAVVEARLLGPVNAPSKNRWGSFSSTLAEMTAGVMLHAVLPRAFAKAFAKAFVACKPGLADEGSGEVDHREVARSKVCRARDFLRERAENLQCALMTRVSEPMDF